MNPTSTADQEYSASKEVTSPIVNSILSQDGLYSYEALADKLSSVAVIKKRKRSSTASQLKASFPPDLQRAMDLSQAKGASNWFTVLPVEEFGFSLHKGALRDALALCYSWPLHNTPSRCSCGTNFTVEHSLSCGKNKQKLPLCWRWAKIGLVQNLLCLIRLLFRRKQSKKKQCFLVFFSLEPFIFSSHL